MHKYLLTMIFFFILTSCTKNNESTERSVENLESIEVTGVKMNVSENLYQIRDISLVNIEDKYFALISDASNAPPVHLINVSEDSYISGLSREGRGPGEFSQPLTISDFDGSFVITDPRNSRVTYIPKEVFKDSTIRDHSKFQMDNLQFSGLPLNVHPINSNNYVVVGPIRTTENRRFTMINTAKETNSYFGSHDSTDSNIDPHTTQLSNREYGTFSNNNSMFATGKYHKDQIDIFDFEGNPVTSYKGPDYDQLDFEIDGDQYELDDENNIVGFVNITSNDDYIYGLYSGKKLNESQSNFGDSVVVIDWNGKFVNSFQLDQKAFSIAVNDDNSLLLTGVLTEKAGLYMYRINQ